MNGLAARLYVPWIAANAAAATAGRPGPSGAAILPDPRALLPKITALSGISFRRPLPEWPATLGRLGSLEIRLATSAAEILRVQRLRYKIFYGEMSAAAGLISLITQRDLDEFDPICDHLLVFDTCAEGPANVAVATCRLLRQDVAERRGGFYTAGEYRLAELIDRHRALRFLELGRSCVLRPYRGKRTVELLWHGIWSYAVRHGIDVLVGCASFEGTDPDHLGLPLSYPHNYASAQQPWRLGARPRRYIEMNRLPKRAVDIKAALADLPPLIKGYLRLGAYVGHGAVIDRKFGTTAVAIVLPVSAINTRYIQPFGSAAGRYAAES